MVSEDGGTIRCEISMDRISLEHIYHGHTCWKKTDGMIVSETIKII